MKKTTKKKVKEESVKEPIVVEPEVVETQKVIPKNLPIDKLTISFPSVDMNKVVEKINELIDKSNDSI